MSDFEQDKGDGAFCGWLSDLPKPLAMALLERSDPVAFDADQIIYSVGEETRSLWCVLSGAVRMNIATNDNEHRFGHLATPGFWFGEYELLTGQARLIEMQAAIPSRLLRVPRLRFEDLARQDPELWRWLAVLSTQHMLLTLTAADDLMMKGARSRCAAVLLRLSGHRGAHPATAVLDLLPVNQTDMSEALSMSRSSTGAQLRQLEEDGVIELLYGTIKLRDLDALKALAAAG